MQKKSWFLKELKSVKQLSCCDLLKLIREAWVIRQKERNKKDEIYVSLLGPSNLL